MDDRHLTVNQTANAVGISREREHFAQPTWHVKGFCSVAATAFDACSKAHQAGHVAGEVLKQIQLVLLNVSSPKWVPGPQIWARDQTHVHAVETTIFSPSKEGQGGVISTEGDGILCIVFFDHLHKSQTINGEHYANLLRQIWKAIKSRWPRKMGGPVSPGQCSCIQVCVCNGCCAWPWLWTHISQSFSLFSWFGTFWLFSVSQHEKNNYWLGSTFGLMMRSFLRWGLFWISLWQLL